MVGSFVTGIFLQIFRPYCSPYVLFAIFAFFFACSMVLMFFISVSSLAMYITMVVVGLVSGGSFVLVGVTTHESYGGKHVAKIIGFIWTGAAFGILLY